MLTGLMLYALWAVLITIGLNVLLGVIRAVMSNSFSAGRFTNFLQSDILYNVLPLLIIAHIMPMDPTGWLVLVFYYAAALAIVLNNLKDIIGKLMK